MVRFAKAVHQEAPHLLPGVGALSTIRLAQAESGIHQAIARWGMTLPLEIAYWNKGIKYAPMLRVQTWFEYFMVRRSKILLGGFEREDPAVPHLLESFWRAFRFDEPTHSVYSHHQDSLSTCVPVFLYLDEGRGLRKSPILVVALETLFGQDTAKEFNKIRKKKKWDDETLWSIQNHTCAGSPLVTRLLLYVLPNKAYKGKRNQFWYQVMDQVAQDLARTFHDGVRINGRKWYPILVGCKGDAPALAKLGRMTRTFQHLTGKGGICCHCLAGRPGLSWEDMRDDAAWRATLHCERPWLDSKPSCLALVPYSDAAPERMFRSDPMHLIKLGISRHFIASAIVLWGLWDVWAGCRNSVEKTLALAETDFFFCCRTEIHQTPHLKGLTRELLHWPKRSSYPWGGNLDIVLGNCFSIHIF